MHLPPWLIKAMATPVLGQLIGALCLVVALCAALVSVACFCVISSCTCFLAGVLLGAAGTVGHGTVWGRGCTRSGGSDSWKCCETLNATMEASAATTNRRPCFGAVTSTIRNGWVRYFARKIAETRARRRRTARRREFLFLYVLVAAL